jgi:hypothetical protein
MYFAISKAPVPAQRPFVSILGSAARAINQRSTWNLGRARVEKIVWEDPTSIAARPGRPCV